MLFLLILKFFILFILNNKGYLLKLVGRSRVYIGILISLYFQISVFSQPVQVSTAFKIYKETPNQETATLLSKSYREIAKWFCEMPQYNADSTRYYFNAAEEILIRHSITNELLEVYRSALSTYNVYSPAQADSISAKAWTYMESKFSSPTDRKLYYEILYYWAIATNQTGDRSKALSLYSKAYELVKDESLPSIQAGLLADRGNIYLSLGDSYESTGYPYIQQSILLYENSKDKKDLKRLYQNYSNMGWRYNTLDQFDSCLVFFEKEKKLLDSIKDPMVHFEYYANYGNVLSRMGKKEEAKKNLLLGHELNLKYKMDMNSINRFNLSLLGVAYREEASYDKAIDYFKQSHKIYTLLSPKGFDADNMENIAIAMEKKGDYKQALEFQKIFAGEYIKYLQSLNSKTVREQELLTDLKLQEKDLSTKKNERNILFLSLLVTLLLSGLLSVFYRHAYNRKKALEDQNKTIESQANTLRQQDINKTRFFANVSHELRTPLTLMLGPLNSVLQSEKLDEKNKSLLSIARQNAKQLMNLVNEILDITKAESVQAKVQYKPTPVYGFFKRLISNFESYTHQRKVKLLFSIDPALPHSILMDTNKIERIFNNLLSNALKFTQADGTITVKIMDEKARWSLIVADTGRGIHPDDQPFVFDRFYQGSQRNMNLEGGTGIGLSLSKDLATAMHGSLTLHSIVDQGSTFTLTLPKTEVIGDESIEVTGITHTHTEVITDQTTDVALEVHGLIDDRNSPHQEIPSILIVEDNLSLREYLTIILSEKYSVKTVMNGKEALTYLEGIAQPYMPDLIITDIMMPVMDGFELLEKLKSNLILQYLPVVMLTARTGNEDRLKALRIGVDDYLTKPFEEEELLARIRNLMVNAQQRKHTHKMEANTKEDNPIELNHEDFEWLKRLESESLVNVSNSHFTVDNLADRMHISRAQFFRRVQFITGMTPLQYLQAIKYNHARTLLEQQKVTSVKAAAAAIGVTKVQYFSEQFKERFGKSPSEYLS